jgi:hypothetical protein
MKKLIASAGTIEQLEKLINRYFYSTSYKIDGEQVTNAKNRKLSCNIPNANREGSVTP